MKKISAITTLSLAIILLAGCQQQQLDKKQPISKTMDEQEISKNTPKEDRTDWKIFSNNEFEFKYPNFLMFQDNDPSSRSLFRVDQHEELITNKKSISGIHAPELLFELNTKKNENDVIVKETKHDNYNLIVATPYQSLGCFYYIESSKINIQFSALRSCNDDLTLDILSTFKIK